MVNQRTVVNKYSKMAVIPGGLTKKLQPLDIARRDEAVSGESDYVHDDTFSEMEEIPKEILNAIDSFNVESDEEFLGFE